jgi:hypothetical protein
VISPSALPASTWEVALNNHEAQPTQPLSLQHSISPCLAASANTSIIYRLPFSCVLGRARAPHLLTHCRISLYRHDSTMTGQRRQGITQRSTRAEQNTLYGKAKLEYLLQKDPNNVLSGQPGGHQHGHRDGSGMWLRELKPPDDRVGRTQRS